MLNILNILNIRALAKSLGLFIWNKRELIGGIYNMEIAVVGVNHNTSPVEVREKLSFTKSKKIKCANRLLEESIEEIIIISTCNRSEIYVVGENIDIAIEKVKRFYTEFFEYPDAHKYLFSKKSEDVISHLYKVAGGLDSIVLGEDQILNQIKQAMNFSLELGFSKKILNRLFMGALSAGKKIRSHMKISEIPLSTSYIGVKLLKEEIGTLKGKKALVIGAGEISKLSLKYLLEEDLGEIYHTNRTHGKLKEIFKEYPDLKPMEYKDRYDVLEKVDILITATGAPHTIIMKEDMKPIHKPLHILDLAIPRDVDDALREDKNVSLYHIDDLRKVSDQNLLEREKLSKEAALMIEEDVDEYLNWLECIKVDPILESLNERCSCIKDNTLDYINRKLDLDPREKKIVEKMIGSALRRVIREPIKTLKTTTPQQSGEYMEIVKELFQI